MTDLIWNKAFEMVIGNEGGYTNTSADRGNWTSGKIGIGELKGTKYGISAMCYPHLDIANLTLEQARDIYHKDYWCRYKCDCLPDAVGLVLFDSVVNSNAKRMIKFLQECLGVSADGIMGNQTIGACNRIPQKQIINNFLDKRLNYLMSLKDWKYFGKGWSNRIKHVREYAEGLI